MLFTQNILLVDDNTNDVLKFKAILNKIDDRILINNFSTLEEATKYALDATLCLPDVIFIHNRASQESPLKLTTKMKAHAAGEIYNTCVFSLTDGSDRDIESIIVSGLRAVPGKW